MSRRGAQPPDQQSFPVVDAGVAKRQRNTHAGAHRRTLKRPAGAGRGLSWVHTPTGRT